MRVIGWHLTNDEKCGNDDCENKASVIVVLDDEITTENRCESCLPAETPDPILDVFAQVFGARN